jgi:hypothetical protein
MRQCLLLNLEEEIPCACPGCFVQSRERGRPKLSRHVGGLHARDFSNDPEGQRIRLLDLNHLKI